MMGVGPLQSHLQSILKPLGGVKSLDSVVSNPCLILSEPLCHSLSPMNPDTVILEYVRAIREEKNLLMEEPI